MIVKNAKKYHIVKEFILIQGRIFVHIIIVMDGMVDVCTVENSHLKNPNKRLEMGCRNEF